MEKFLKWGSDISDIREDIDDCQREDIRERAKDYFSDKKDVYSEMFSELVEKGKEVLADEETQAVLKIALLILIAFLLLIVACGLIRRRK